MERRGAQTRPASTTAIGGRSTSFTTMPPDGLPSGLRPACAEAIAHGVHYADVVLSILAGQHDPGPPGHDPHPRQRSTLRRAPVTDLPVTTTSPEP